MKAVFPCKGVVVLNKKDVQILELFYNNTLASSKLAEMYNATEYMTQIGKFNYLSPKNKDIVDKNNSFILTKIDSTLENNISQNEKNLDPKVLENDFLSHPFFTTLKPLN